MILDETSLAIGWKAWVKMRDYLLLAEKYESKWETICCWLKSISIEKNMLRLTTFKDTVFPLLSKHVVSVIAYAMKASTPVSDACTVPTSSPMVEFSLMMNRYTVGSVNCGGLSLASVTCGKKRRQLWFWCLKKWLILSKERQVHSKLGPAQQRKRDLFKTRKF